MLVFTRSATALVHARRGRYSQRSNSLQPNDKTRILVAFRSSPRYAEGMNRKLAARCLAELGNLTRLDIYRLLVRAGPSGLSITDIQTRLGIPASTLAFHLRGL